MADEIDGATSNMSDESSADDSSESEPELMVTTRERRKTAGNRYTDAVGQEQEAEDDEDDMALLFAEAEGEDEEYNSDEGDDDADMSSSDDDDQGPNVAADDLEGEKELQKKEKVERQRKRKADLALTTMAGLKKKPKIDPTSLHRAPERPKPSKRKERVSWLPAQDNAPGRTSLRKQTIAHRETTHARLKENEKHRLKQKAIREQKEKEREADAPKEMTQADRLLEAERVERRNAKSLNRWEATEKKRAEEQAAKLAALRERKLDGAVITWHSSAHKYKGLKPDRLSPGPTEGGTELKKRGRKSKAFLEQMAAAKNMQEAQSKILPARPFMTAEPATQSTAPFESGQSQPIHAIPQEEASSLLTGIHEYASMPSDSTKLEGPSEKSEDVATKPETPTERSKDIGTQPALSEETVQESQPDDSETQPQKTPDVRGDPSPGPADVATDLPTDRVETTEPSNPPPTTDPTTTDPKEDQPNEDKAGHDQALPEQQPTETNLEDQKRQEVETAPPIEVVSTRNLVVLDKFEELSSSARNDYNMFYSTRKLTKPSKHTAELCPISGHPVKYRDPVSGVGYANVAAFKKLKDLRQYQFNWSSMLGCYVGRSGVVARGVPEGFLEAT